MNDYFEPLLTNEYALFLVAIAISVLIGVFIHFLIANYFFKKAQQTKTKVDDFIVGLLVKPAYIIILVIGSYVSLNFLSIVEPYGALLDKLFFVSMIVVVFYLISSISSFLISNQMSVKRKFKKTPKLVKKIVSIFVYLIGFLVLLGYFDINVTPAVAAIGFGGLVVGLALKDTLSNFFSGIHIVSDKIFDIGDFIELQGSDVSGYITDIGWRSTRIRTFANTIAVIPNSKITESTVFNENLPENETSAYITCGVSYDSDLKKVEKIALDVANKIQKKFNPNSEFSPKVRYYEFGDSNINFRIILRAEDYPSTFLIKHEFIKALKEAFDKNKIEISWPVRKIVKDKK